MILNTHRKILEFPVIRRTEISEVIVEDEKMWAVRNPQLYSLRKVLEDENLRKL